jgi:hypothetical protein
VKGRRRKDRGKRGRRDERRESEEKGIRRDKESVALPRTRRKGR